MDTLTGQRSNKHGEFFEFADDGAFMLASREDMIMGTSILHTHLQRFGMLMHVGSRATDTSEGIKSKTEAVNFPPRDTRACCTKVTN